MTQDMFLKGEKLSTHESQADTFNTYFMSTVSNYDQSSDSLDCKKKINSDLESITVTEKEVFHILQHLDSKKPLASSDFCEIFFQLCCTIHL